MAKVIDLAKAHFSAKARIRVEVPEWAEEEGKPFVVCASPLTLADRAKIERYRNAEGNNAAMAYTVIFKAENEAGEKIFTLEDKRALMTKVDPNVLARLAVAIAVEESRDPEDPDSKK